jgi:multicomponent Na+:H+ antiporter subunit F
MFFLICIIVIAVLAILCLNRAIIGPKLADRIMAVNMMGTLTIAVIILMSVLLDESMMLDVALVYAVISFVAVMVLTQIYIGIFREKRQLGQKEGEKDED